MFDLDLTSIYIRSCKARLRIWIKAPSLRSYISDVIKMKIKKIDKKASWESLTKRWISTYGFLDTLKKSQEEE
jgi:hypothetical protein